MAATAIMTGTAFWAIRNGKLAFPIPSYEVTKVIDGDSFVTKENQPIRLMYVDAPEMGRCGSEEAKKELEKLILNKPISMKIVYQDTYRLYAKVFSDQGYVNEKMIKSGWAQAHTGKDEDRQLLVDAAEYAMTNKLGIFGNCHSLVPEKSGCVIKGNVSLSVPGKKSYSFPNCGSYQRTIIQKELGDEWFCTEKEAKKAGYTKSADCPN